jgi:subtilisin family serine protease
MIEILSVMSNPIRFIPDISDRILSVVSTLTEQNNWGLHFANVDEAWKHSKGEGVKVAVIDTGWYAHKDLVKNFVEGHDATGGNDYNDNSNGHGVHVAGVIAANTDPDTVGVTGFAPNSKLYIIKALDSNGCGRYDYLINSLNLAKNMDVDIVNMSLGSPVPPENDQMHNAIKEIAAQGKIIVCAAGNDGGNVNYPAKYDEVIAVAALDEEGKMAKFSSRGPELDTAAPGVNIYSTWINNQYVKLNGTSMATPAISGIIALIISMARQKDPSFKPDYQNILKALYQLGEANIINMGSYSIGTPKFCNLSFETLES